MFSKGGKDTHVKTGIPIHFWLQHVRLFQSSKEYF